MEFNLKRPKRVGEESEEDLLKFQEDFLKNKLGQPAAKVVKTYETDSEKKVEEKKLQVDFDADNQSMIAVLGEVVEKPLRNEFNEAKEGHQLAVKPFPRVEKLNLKELTSSSDSSKSETKPNKSLFAQNLERQGKLKSFFALNQVHLEKQEKLKEFMEKNKVLKEECVNKQIITGEGLGSKKEVEKIHLENLDILSKLKPDEVLKEQQKIIEQLDPKLVAFIKRRGKQASETAEGKPSNEPSNASSKRSDSNEQVLNEEILEQLPIKPNKKWLNMNKIEYDKLEWMLKPSKVQTNRSQENVAARFDFDGNVLAPDADVPVTRALHHHGNEPDAPGYSLDELFHLARSKFAQQRVLAIQTLGNILNQCHLGTYHQIIKSQEEDEEKEMDVALDDKNNLLNQLIDGGILFLLRWNLDDQTESIINASLNALRHLVQPGDQENALDLVFDLNRGQECPSLHPFSSIFLEHSAQLKVDKHLNVSEKQDLNELRDDEFIRHDLIRGLFRMNLMERFVYLLDKYKPSLASNSIQQNILLILCRCVRHSAELCFQFVEKHGNLLDLIVKHFVPLFISHQDNVLNVTLTNAAMSVKLLRLICSSGSNLALKLYEKYELNQVLVNYLTVDTYIESSSVEHELTQLQLESVRLVKVLLTVSANTNRMARELVITPYEVLLKKTLSLLSRSDMDSKRLHLQALIGLFDTLVHTMHEDDADLKLKYEICTNLFDQIGQFTTKCLKQESQEIDFDLMSICIDYLVDYLSKLNEIGLQSKAENVHHKFEQIDALIESIVHPFLSSNQLRLDRLVMSRLMTHSTSQTNEQFEKIRSNNLSYLPTISSVPNEWRQNPFAFMASFVRCVLLCFTYRCKSIDIKLVRLFLNNAYLKSYLKAFGKKSAHQTSSYLKQKYENHFVYYLLKLALNVFALEDDENRNECTLKRFEEKKFFYSVALSLLCQLKCGDECYAYDLIACFLFNTQMWSHCLSDVSHGDASNEPTSLNVLIRHFEQFDLSEKIVLKHGQLDSTHSTIVLNKNTLSKLQSDHIFESLHQIKFAYLDNLFNRRQLDLSRQLVLNKVQLKSLFVSELNSNQCLFNADWIYWPIVNELRKSELNKRSSEFKAMTKSDESKLITCISNCLKCVYLLEAYHGEHLDSSLSHTRRYVRLLYVYLFDSEVFLDRQIVTYLYLILFKYANDARRPLEKLNFAEKIDEIISFYDFYQNLLTHYDATSFGDYVFSLFLIVPLQQVYNVKYRQLFWSDFSHLFKFIKFNDDNAKLLLPLANFTQPNEKSLHLIRLYTQLVLDVNDFRLIEQSRFAYAIIVAHLNSFIFEHIDSHERHVEYEFKKLLIERFSSLQNQKLKNDLITFKSVNPKTNAIEFYDQLPNIRAQWLAQFNF